MMHAAKDLARKPLGARGRLGRIQFGQEVQDMCVHRRVRHQGHKQPREPADHQLLIVLRAARLMDGAWCGGPNHGVADALAHVREQQHLPAMNIVSLPCGANKDLEADGCRLGVGRRARNAVDEGQPVVDARLDPRDYALDGRLAVLL